MKQVFLETFGCQMNVADSEMIEGILQSKNYSSINSIDKADIIVVLVDHSEFKSLSAAKLSEKIIIDTRGIIN